MRFYLSLFFCVSVFFTACTDDKKIPKDVIQEHEMAELLTDIHMVDGSLYDIAQVPDTLAKHGLGMYMGVFKVHHVDTALFNKSIKYYSTRPEILYEIYTGVTKRLQKKIDSLQAHKPKQNVDSLKKVQVKEKADSTKRVHAQITLDSMARIRSQRKLDSIQRNIKPKQFTPQKKLELHKVKKSKIFTAHAVPAQ